MVDARNRSICANSDIFFLVKWWGLINHRESSAPFCRIHQGGKKSIHSLLGHTFSFLLYVCHQSCHSITSSSVLENTFHSQNWSSEAPWEMLQEKRSEEAGWGTGVKILTLIFTSWAEIAYLLIAYMKGEGEGMGEGYWRMMWCW